MARLDLKRDNKLIQNICYDRYKEFVGYDFFDDNIDESDENVIKWKIYCIEALQRLTKLNLTQSVRYVKTLIDEKSI